ncbi:hypothetical protein Barb6XT_00099 [Bacteroidales bacterium Barb6XT]|nr:hypothetical protein Barb6XT_00099 [Bacteroidales bacterium Barb6XT]
MKKITIAEVEYNLRYTVRSLIIFGQLKENAEMKGEIVDESLMYYAVLAANNKETFRLSYDDFIDIEVSVFVKIREWMKDEQAIVNLLSGKQEEPDAGSEKKNT